MVTSRGDCLFDRCHVSKTALHGVWEGSRVEGARVPFPVTREC